MNNQLDQCYNVFNLKQENISKELLRKCYFRECDKNGYPLKKKHNNNVIQFKRN